MKAYILVNAKVGQTRAVVRQLGALRGVKSAHACWGKPDIFALADVKHEKALRELVLSGVQKIRGVESTDTHIVVEEL
jgi:DNA-binding Lrp family transcriptional regulator